MKWRHLSIRLCCTFCAVALPTGAPEQAGGPHFSLANAPWLSPLQTCRANKWSKLAVRERVRYRVVSLKTEDGMATPKPPWLNYQALGALVGRHGLESTPFFFGGKLPLMQSMEGHFSPGGAHSYFCVFDAESGEKLSCPNSSSGSRTCRSWAS